MTWPIYLIKYVHKVTVLCFILLWLHIIFFMDSSNVSSHIIRGCFTGTGAEQHLINSLALGRPGCHFKTAIFNLVLLIGIFTSSNDNVLRWMPWHLTDDKSTLIQVMAWSPQATSHYLSQCWPRSMSPNGITRPQWVKTYGRPSMGLLNVPLGQ